MSTTERPATMPDGRSIDWFDDVGVIAGPEGLRFVAAVNGDIWDANAWHQIGASFAIYRALAAERAAREAAERECERLRRVIEGTPEARWTPGDLKDGQRFTFSSMNLGVCLRRFLEGWSIQMPRKHRGQGCYADCLTAELVCRWLNVRGAVEVKA